MGYVPGGRNPLYSKTEIWTSIHTGMAIVCACLPTFGPLVAKIAGSRLARSISDSAVVEKVSSLVPGRRRMPPTMYDVMESLESEETRVVTQTSHEPKKNNTVSGSTLEIRSCP